MNDDARVEATTQPSPSVATVRRSRISDKRRAEIESGARHNFGASPYGQHKYSDSEVMGLCLDLRDERVSSEQLETALSLLVATVQRLGDVVPGGLDACERTNLSTARAALGDAQPTMATEGGSPTVANDPAPKVLAALQEISEWFDDQDHSEGVGSFPYFTMKQALADAKP